MSARWIYNSPTERWDIPDATSTGRQTYGGRFGAWYTNQEILRIVGSLLKSLSKVSDRNITQQVWDLVNVFIEMLVQLKVSGYEMRNLPPLTGTILDDGAFLVEWLSHNYRVGFVFETNAKDSMWYLVEKGEAQDENKSGSLGNENKQEILRNLITYVASNS